MASIRSFLGRLSHTIHCRSVALQTSGTSLLIGSPMIERHRISSNSAGVGPCHAAASLAALAKARSRSPLGLPLPLIGVRLLRL